MTKNLPNKLVATTDTRASQTTSYSASSKHIMDAHVRASIAKTLEPDKPITGRPSDYTEEKAEEVCALIAEGQTLNQAAEVIGTSARSIMRWLAKSEAFRQNYAGARLLQGDADADEAKHVMRRVIDPNIPEDQRLDANQARVAIDTLKWCAGKRAPAKYGDKITAEVTGKDGTPLNAQPPPLLATARWIADLLLTADANKKKDEGSE